MKKTTLLVSSVLAFQVSAQVPTTVLDYNNASLLISNQGVLFNNTTNTTSAYEIPKGSGKSIIFDGQLWFAGKDTQGTLHTSLGGNPGSGMDVMPGPFSSSGDYDESIAQYGYMASICQADIDAYDLWWECDNGLITVGCGNATIPAPEVLDVIYTWPAHGDVGLGQPYYLFPFYDRDSDGYYDPIGDGDYPLIKGCCATYMIRNDDGVLHTLSNTDPIGLEIHVMLYQFGANDLLYNTTFMDVMAINRGSTTYPEFAQGLYLDSDVGNYDDDFFGCDSTNGVMYFYNGDNFDEDAGGQIGYGTNPPAIGVVGLDTTVTACAQTFNIMVPSAAWNTLQGLQGSGDPLVHPDGYNTNFELSGNPNDPMAWSEVSSGSLIGDRRGVISSNHGPLNPGDTLRQTYAIVFADGTGDHLDNAEEVIALAGQAKLFFDTEINDGCEAGGILGVNEVEQENSTIFPNPSSGVFTIEFPSSNDNAIEIVDVRGRVVLELGASNKQSITIDLSEFGAGIYLVKLTSDLGEVVKRVVIE